MIPERQTLLISRAYKEAGLDGHIKLIHSQKQTQTWAERIAMRFKG